MTQEKTIWRVFLNGGVKEYKDFDSAESAWEYTQSLPPAEGPPYPYVHTIKPGGHPYPR